MYGATRRDTAFVESLAWKAPSSDTFAAISQEAAFTGTPVDEILAELRDLGAPIGQVGDEWCENHSIYTLQSSDEIWVDPADRGNLALLTGMIGGAFTGHRRLTVADLTGDDRSITTSMAQTLRELPVLDEHGNSTRISGIRYLSKFGPADDNDYCWALWLDAPYSGMEIIDEMRFAADDPDVVAASRLTGVYVPS